MKPDIYYIKSSITKLDLENIGIDRNLFNLGLEITKEFSSGYVEVKVPIRDELKLIFENPKAEYYDIPMQFLTKRIKKNGFNYFT